MTLTMFSDITSLLLGLEVFLIELCSSPNADIVYQIMTSKARFGAEGWSVRDHSTFHTYFVQWTFYRPRICQYGQDPADLTLASEPVKVLVAHSSGYYRAILRLMSSVESRTRGAPSGEMFRADTRNSPRIRAFSGPRERWLEWWGRH
jgi:hypothetical protein